MTNISCGQLHLLTPLAASYLYRRASGSSLIRKDMPLWKTLQTLRLSQSSVDR